MTIADEPLDPFGCDREPPDQPAAIQPIGFLIAVSREWKIVRVSDNVAAYAGRSASDLIGLPLGDLFAREALHALRNRLVPLDGNAVERLSGLALLTGHRERRFDCTVHEAAGLFVIEAEPSDPTETAEPAGLVRAMIGRLDAADELGTFLQQGARQIHGLTGFDRVVICRFGADGSGEIVAEAVRSGITPLLGSRCPAADVPRQARAHYLRTPFRIVCDVASTPAAIVPSDDATGRPLDLSLSALRAASPRHIADLRAMGVAASLSLPIIVERRLWGLFACHHCTPRRLDFNLRTPIALFGDMFSMQLESRERRTAAAAQAAARQTGDRLIATIAGDIGLLKDPSRLMATLGDILPCDGVGVSLKDRTARSGVSPPTDILPALARRSSQIAPGKVFATDHLIGVLPEAGVAAGAPAGMLAIPISSGPDDYVMLFRRAHPVTARDDPHAPRREERRDRCEPFTAHEQAIAATFRAALIGIVLPLADAAVAERLRANQRQDVLITELNHRVRNILALINGLVRKSGDAPIAPSEYADLLEGRILAVARAHDQIARDGWGPAHIRRLFEAEGAHHIAAGRMTLSDVPVMLEPLAFSTLSLVVHELVTNAAKDGALSGRGRVDIDWTIEREGDLALEWHERNGPAGMIPRRDGLGTTIIEQLLAHDLGGFATVTHDAAGVQARFVIPSRHVRAADPIEANPQGGPISTAAAAADDDMPIDGPVLLVEDSLLIAVHVEDILQQIGVGRVVTAATVAAALAEIDGVRPACAVLDFNLGDEDSLPVADRLRADRIPYLFATGYGEQLMLPGGHAGVPILHKPYTKANLAAAMRRAFRHSLAP